MLKGGIEKAPENGKQHHRTDDGRFQAETARRVPRVRLGAVGSLRF
jgi:hypothetical protein